MTDFWEGIVIFLCGLGVVFLLVGWTGRAIVYNDNYRTELMQSCQNNGYSWGDCYNVIHGDQEAFTK